MEEATPLDAIVEPAACGEQYTDPQEDAAGPFSAGADAEALQRFGQIAAVGQGNQTGDAEAELGTGFPFAAPVCCNDAAFADRNLAQSGDEKFPENDDNGNPEGTHACVGEVDEGGAHQNLIRQRVHQFAEIRNQVIFAGQVSVQKVRNGGYHECPERDAGCGGDGAEPATCYRVDFCTRHAVHCQDSSEKNDQSNAAEREDVRQVQHGYKQSYIGRWRNLQDKIEAV